MIVQAQFHFDTFLFQEYEKFSAYQVLSTTFDSMGVIFLVQCTCFISLVGEASEDLAISITIVYQKRIN